MNLASVTVGMIDRPAEAMRAATQRPRAWWLPAILLLLSMVALLWISQPYAIKLVNEQSARTVERLTAKMSAEQAKTVRDSVKPVTATMYWLSGLGLGLAAAGAGWLVRGTVIHFSSMAVGGTSIWDATFAGCLWSMLPFFVRDLVQVAYVLVRQQLVAHQGLAFMVASGDPLNDGRNLVYALLSSVDLFAGWHVVLLSIAIAAATRLSRGKSFAMALAVWAVFTALKLVPVVVSGALTGGLGG